MQNASATGRVLIAATILSLGLRTRPLVSQSIAAQAPPTATAQTPPTEQAAMPQWQIAAGGRMKFATVSVRKDVSGKFKTPSFALSADDGWSPADGNFHADFPLIVYIQFAYKLWLTPEETRPLFASLPKWVLSDTYEVQARAAGKPSKDQMRLMMQTLLAERFGLKVHFERRQLSVYNLTLIKPGTMGPRLRPHAPSCEGGQPAKDSPAATQPAKGASTEDIFPPPCLDQALMTIPKPNHVKLTGTRNTTMALIATYLSSIGELDRPVVDKTGLQGRVDFSLEFTPDSALPVPTGVETETDSRVTTFKEALQVQLGLKLVSAKAALDVLVVDHVERPLEN